MRQGAVKTQFFLFVSTLTEMFLQRIQKTAASLNDKVHSGVPYRRP